MLSLPGYQSVEMIHLSAKSRVFRAKRSRDQLPVILKTMVITHPSAEEIAAFKHEYALTRRLAGQGVIATHGLERAHNGLFLVLEEMGGEPLFGYFVKDEHEVRMFLELAIRICRTLAHVHQEGVVHKDINPGNILWNRENGEVRLIDFSIASELDSMTMEPEDLGWLEGTPAYISPEQTGRLNRNVDQRSDIYSLGATFYELLGGQPPFLEPDRAGLVYAAIARDPELLEKVNPKIPAMMARIVARMMAKDPDSRYNGVYGLGMDLERCLSEWVDAGRIETFPLGQNDKNDQYRLPRKVYGRETEWADLFACLARARRGGKVLALVEGEEGIGKSALISMICAQVPRDGGVVAHARFSRATGQHPYAAIRKAFAALTEHWFHKPGADLDAFRRQVITAIGRDGPLLAALVPGLETIIGVKPENTNLEESRDRLILALPRFIRSYIRKAKPLIFFLDDLQWADKDSLDLIFTLLSDPSIGHCLFIGAMRPLGEKLHEGLADLPGKGVFVKHIQPGPLGTRDLRRLLTDAVNGDPIDIQEAAHMIIARTGGNPLYINELLKHLNRERLLFFDDETNRWVWRLDGLSRLDARESVVDLLITRIGRMSEETLRVLQLAACLAEEIDLELLLLVSNKTPKELGRCLRQVLNEEVLVRLYERGHFAPNKQPSPRYRFQHQRLRAAAYKSLDVARQVELHLRIGRIMQAQSADSGNDSDLKLLDWIDHLNRGMTLIKNRQERTELAALNLAAGKMNLVSASYSQALPFFKIGFELLGKRPWRNHYALAFPLMLHLAKTFTLLGQDKKARTRYQSLSRYARTDLEKARVLAVQKFEYTERGLKGHTEKMLKGLNLLGIHLSATPSKALANREMAEVQRTLADKSALTAFKESTDPIADTTQSLLVKLAWLSRVMGNRNLFVLTTARAVRLSLEHGLTPDTATAFALLGVFCALNHDQESAGTYGDFAMELVSQDRYLVSRGLVLILVALNVYPAQYHLKAISGLFEKAAEACFKTHDVFIADLAIGFIAHWDPCSDLEQKIKREQKAMAHFFLRFPGHLLQAALFHYFHLSLCDGTDHHLSLNNSDFNEKQVPRLHGFQAVLLTLKIQLHFIHDRVHEALALILRAEPLISAFVGPSLVQVKFCFYSFLVCAAVIKEKKSPGELRERLHSYLVDMRRWVADCPLNFEHRLLLMEAELASIDDKRLQAMTLYERAVKLARSREYSYHVALIQDCASRYFMRNQGRIIAGAFLREAEYGYARWGASARCRTIRESYPDLFQMAPPVQMGEAEPRSIVEPWNTTDHSSSLDLTSAIKAAQIITSERKLNLLLEKIMRIVLENAGAQRGCLVMPTPTGPRVEALASNEGVLLESLPLNGETAHEFVPLAVITRVAQTQSSLIANDPALQGELSRDPYIQTVRPRSILCLALAKKGKLLGILYLEHRQTAGLFNEEHVGFLELLTTAAAISIENTRYFARLEDQVSIRTRDLDARTRELESLDETVRSINREREPEKVYHQVLSQGLVLFPEAGRAALFLINDKGIYSPVAAVDYRPENLVQLTLPVSVAESTFLTNAESWGRQIYRLAGGLHIPDGGGPNEGVLEGTRLLLMLKQAGVEIGFILWNGERFTRSQVPMLERFANHAASAVSRARFLEELAQKSEEIKTKSEAIVATRDQLIMREKMAQLGALTASISREITTPNAFVRNVSAAFEKTRTEFHHFLNELAAGERAVLEDFERQFSKVSSQLQQVRVGVERIDRIVETLAFVSHLDEADFQELDLVPLLQSAIDEVAPQFHNIDMELRPCPRLRIASSRNQMNLVFENLILNACQAIQRRLSSGLDSLSGRVSICLERQQDEAVVHITDNGCGISEEVMPQLFEAFFTTLPVGSGMGLGLYCVWSIMEKAGGTVVVESDQQMGAVFTLRFPIKGGNT